MSARPPARREQQQEAARPGLLSSTPPARPSDRFRDGDGPRRDDERAKTRQIHVSNLKHRLARRVALR